MYWIILGGYRLQDFTGWFRLYYLVQCVCGDYKLIRKTRKISNSCGCQSNITHGHAGTIFYQCWNNMISRCHRPKHSHYQYYGARGINVCDSWQQYEGFRDDMLSSYVAHALIFGEKDTTIERKDHDAGYNINNCTWATRKEQAISKPRR